MQFHVIQAGVRHLDLIAPLFDAYRVFYKQSSDIARAREFLRARIEHGESVIFVAVDQEGLGAKAHGFTQLYPTFSSVSTQPTWILNDLYVDKEARRKGVGEALMNRARELALATGAKGLGLSTAVDNLTAQALYESLGYKRDTAFYHYFLAAPPAAG